MLSLRLAPLDPVILLTSVVRRWRTRKERLGPLVGLRSLHAMGHRLRSSAQPDLM